MPNALHSWRDAYRSAVNCGGIFVDIIIYDHGYKCLVNPLYFTKSPNLHDANTSDVSNVNNTLDVVTLATDCVSVNDHVNVRVCMCVCVCVQDILIIMSRPIERPKRTVDGVREI